jgi:hypothetical protein
MLRMTYSPVALVRVVCVTLVAVFVKLIDACGMTAPVVSLSVPFIEAAERCAQLALGKATSIINAAISANFSETSPFNRGHGAQPFMNHLLLMYSRPAAACNSRWEKVQIRILV